MWQPSTLLIQSKGNKYSVRIQDKDTDTDIVISLLEPPNSDRQGLTLLPFIGADPKSCTHTSHKYKRIGIRRNTTHTTPTPTAKCLGSKNKRQVVSVFRDWNFIMLSCSLSCSLLRTQSGKAANKSLEMGESNAKTSATMWPVSHW